MTDSPLHFWMCRIRFLGPCSATGLQQLGQMNLWLGKLDIGATAPNGGGTSRRWLQSPLERWSYEAGPWSSTGSVGGMELHGQQVIDPAGWTLGNAKFDLVATSRPRYRI
jgi:hypothetical protein